MSLKRILVKPVGDLNLKEIAICLFILIIFYNVLIYIASFHNRPTDGQRIPNQVESTFFNGPSDDEEVVKRHRTTTLNPDPFSRTFLNLPASRYDADQTTVNQVGTTTFRTQETPRRSWPIPAGSACKRPTKGRSKGDGRWFDFGINGMFLYAYTAFVDDRDSIGTDPVVRIIAIANIIENMAHPPTMFCRFYYPVDDNFVRNVSQKKGESDTGESQKHLDVFVDVQVEKYPIRKIGMGWQLNYKLVREYIFTCPLPSASQLKSAAKNVAKGFSTETTAVPHPSWLTMLVAGGNYDEVTSCMPVEVPEKPKVKKEKSTDCDSALIPLLCVHG